MRSPHDLPVDRRPADRHAERDALLLGLAAAAAAAPVLFGWSRHAGVLDTVAAFLARHGLAGSGLAIPLDWARDGGRLLLAVRVCFAWSAALSLRHFVRAIGLAPVALLAGLLLLLAPGWSTGAQNALTGGALVLWATERCIATRGAPGLALAVATAGALAPAETLPPIVLAAAGWGALRIATGVAGRRLVSAARLVLGLGFGLAFAAPALAASLFATLLAVPSPGSSDAGAEWSAWSARHLISGVRAVLAGTGAVTGVVGALACAFPVLGLALLAPTRGGRARPLRMLIAGFAVAAIVWPAARPLLRLPAVLLAAIALVDAARGASAGPWTRVVAAGVAVGFAVLAFEAGLAPPLIGAGLAGSLASLALAGRPPLAGFAAIAGAIGVLAASASA